MNSRTTALLEIPHSVLKWFRHTLEGVGYQHAIEGSQIDMHGISLAPDKGVGEGKKARVEVWTHGKSSKTLLLTGKKGGRRLAGPKAFGGTMTHSFDVDIDELIEAAILLREGMVKDG